MNPDQFLNRLENVRRHSDTQFDASCPAHDDDRNSLSIGLTADRMLLHCHAGCATGDVLTAMRLELGALFVHDTPVNGNGTISLAAHRAQRVPLAGQQQSRSAPAPVMPPEAIVNAWRGRIGEVSDRLFAVKGWTLGTLKRLGVGWDGQRVVFCVYDQEGTLVGLTRYLPGGDPKTYAVGQRGLWPAPESLNATDMWLVEGEPDRVSGIELGLETVAVPGVGKWRDEWAVRFRGRSVTVCMDADRQGRECAMRRADALDRAGVRVAVVDVAPDRQDGTDLGDLLMYARRDDRLGDLRAYLRRLSDEAWRVAA